MKLVSDPKTNNIVPFPHGIELTDIDISLPEKFCILMPSHEGTEKYNPGQRVNIWNVNSSAKHMRILLGVGVVKTAIKTEYVRALNHSVNTISCQEAGLDGRTARAYLADQLEFRFGEDNVGPGVAYSVVYFTTV